MSNQDTGHQRTLVDLTDEECELIWDESGIAVGSTSTKLPALQLHSPLFDPKDEPSIRAFINLMRQVGEADLARAEILPDGTGRSYATGHGHGYVQCAEEVRAFFGIYEEDDNPDHVLEQIEELERSQL